MDKASDRYQMWQTDFVNNILPDVKRVAVSVFGNRPDRDQQIADVVANAWEDFYRAQLHEKYVTPRSIAYFAVQRAKSGRRVGSSLASEDCYSRTNSNRRLPLNENNVPASKTRLAESVDLRIDLANWLAGYDPRQRSILLSLAAGHKTHAVAKKFCLTAGRISQLRGEYLEAWQLYCRRTASRMPHWFENTEHTIEAMPKLLRTIAS